MNTIRLPHESPELHERAEINADDIAHALAALAVERELGTEEPLRLLVAGKREVGSDYAQVFPRDLLMAIFALGKDIDPARLRDVLEFSCLTQGSTIDPRTGEEPGKILHQDPAPDNDRNGLSYRFSATDTTPFVLTGFGEYLRQTHDVDFVKKYEPAIERAYDWLMRHTQHGLVWDDPRYYQATESAALAGYFRDGGFPDVPGHYLDYPATYTNVNALSVAGLRSLADIRARGLLENLPSVQDLNSQADLIAQTMTRHMWLPEKGTLSAAMHNKGKLLPGTYSDPIWSTYFLEDRDLTRHQWDAMFETLDGLATPWGYANHEQMQGYAEHDTKQLSVVEPVIWPIETAYAMMLGEKHGRREPVERGMGLYNFLSTQKKPFIEALPLVEGEPQLFGCDLQLWTAASLARCLKYRNTLVTESS
jgi:hypothetical protein